MRPFAIEELVQATGGALVNGDPENVIYRVCTDSRNARPGDVFFPLIGEKNDAHDFLGQVLASGCKTIVVSECEKVPKDAFALQESATDIIVVEDTTKALQNLAKHYLSTLPLKKKIAVTGSVGKTSTRDMLYYVANEKYKAARSIKNFNNNFGLPLSIMEFDPDTEIAILEMGMSVRGSIDLLAELTRPDVAVITNIGISHIENFGEDGRMGILSTKLEVTGYFDESNTLIVNSDNDLLGTEKVEGGYQLIRVGSGENCGYKVSEVNDYGDRGISFHLETPEEGMDIRLAVPGAHNAINATLAIAMGNLLGIDTEDCLKGLNKVQLTDKRLSIKTKDGIKVIDDSYNAAPDSVKSAINTLAATECLVRRIAILGDMNELGPETENGHKEVGRHAFEKGIDILIAVGEKSKAMIEGWKEAAGENEYEKVHAEPDIYISRETGRSAEYFENKEMVIAGVKEHIQSGDCVLVKASNAMHLDKVVAKILE